MCSVSLWNTNTQLTKVEFIAVVKSWSSDPESHKLVCAHKHLACPDRQNKRKCSVPRRKKLGSYQLKQISHFRDDIEGDGVGFPQESCTPPG